MRGRFTPFFLGLMALACDAGAQSPVTLMPEGSREGAVGLLVGETWKAQGSSERQALASPYFSMQWSSGAFVEGLSAGWKLSTDQHFQYGPVLAFGDKARGEGGSQLAPGAFLQWRVLHDLELVGRAGVGSQDGQVQAHLAANWIYPLNTDHTLVLHAGTEHSATRSNRLGARWAWRLGRRHTLVGSVTGIRLAGSAARAPGVERRSTLLWWSGLFYSF